MKLQEAEKLLNIDITTDKIDRISESANYFIFSVVPINTDESRGRSFKPSIAIDKHTGRKLAFNPISFPKDEMKTIKRIR